MTSKRRKPARYDLRSVPAAIATWSSLIWAISQPAATVQRSGFVAGSVSLLLIAIRTVARYRYPLNERAWGRIALIWALATGITCSLLLITALHQQKWEETTLYQAAEVGGRVQVRAQLTTDPVESLNTHAWQPQRFRAQASTIETTYRGVTTHESVRIILIGAENLASGIPGQKIEVRGSVRSTNSGEAARVAVFVDGEIQLLEDARGPYAWGAHMRERFRSAAAPLPRMAAELVPAMVIGDRAGVSADTNQALKDTSLTHLTAVSGAHTTVILGAVLIITRPPRRWPRPVRTGIRVIVGGATLLGFVIITGPQPSILRAAAMALVGLMGLLTGRRSQALAALCWAAMVLLTIDPWLARNLGFTLSVLSTAAIVVLAGPITQWLVDRRIPRIIALPLAVSASAQAACIPVLLTIDPRITAYSLPANVVASPIFPLVSLPGTAGLVLAFFSLEIASALLWIATLPALAIGYCALVFAALPGAILPWPSVARVLWGIVISFVIFAGLFPWRDVMHRMSSTARISAWVVVMLVFFGAWGAPSFGLRTMLGVGEHGDSWFAVQCDVGQGDALVLRSDLGAVVLVDAGLPDGRAAKCLQDLGVEKLDLLVLTHWHLDHIGGVPQVLEAVEVSEVWEPAWGEPVATARPIQNLLAGTEITRRTVTAGIEQELLGMRLEVLWPTPRAIDISQLGAADGTSVNDLSTVLAIEMATGETDMIVLALGDIEEAGQRGLRRHLEESGWKQDVDVLKMAHHGSARQSDALARLLKPRAVLIGVGEQNDYGHPSKKAWDMYADLGAQIGSTDRHGQIRLSNPEQLQVQMVLERTNWQHAN